MAMNGYDRKLRIPVHLLRQGLYVAELDRPWVDTPFLFQGFRIHAEEDLETLRAYCALVYVDPERSDPDALAELQRDLGPRAAFAEAGDRRPAGTAAVFGDARYPDQEPFREHVQQAYEDRLQARRIIDAAMRDARLGRTIDVHGARELVEELVTTVSDDPSAALWLTNIKKQDEYTSIHCVNVCVLALAFGAHLGLERHELVRLGVGSLLHDVGKTRTPREILQKPGKLTPDEVAIIKRHPEDGYEIMSADARMSQEALEVIRLHHERLGGQGYPYGLSGDDIPRHALITAVADVYDAMTSDRVYRRAKPADQVLQDLYKNADARFGADLVQEFIRCVGVFPVGSVVELDSRAIGVVVASRPDTPLQPTVLLTRTPQGAPYEKRLLLNLSGERERDDAVAARRIRRAVTPAKAGIDLRRLVANEFGLGSAA